MQTDKNTVQETTVDVQSNIIQFDLKDADSEATIIDDYNRVGRKSLIVRIVFGSTKMIPSHNSRFLL